MHHPYLGPIWDRLRRLGGWPPSGPHADRTDEPAGTALRPDGGEGTDAHLADLPDGAGCTEIWEHLSGREPTEVVGDD